MTSGEDHEQGQNERGVMIQRWMITMNNRRMERKEGRGLSGEEEEEEKNGLNMIIPSTKHKHKRGLYRLKIYLCISKRLATQVMASTN